jgi:hypothetical protein
MRMTQLTDPRPAYSTQTFDCIVSLAQSLRATWDTAGLRDAIRKAMQRDDQPTLAEIAYAVVRCAENFTIVSPAVIPMDGPHWRLAERERIPPSAVRCPRCGSIDMPAEARLHKCKPRAQRAHEAALEAKAIIAANRPVPSDPKEPQ